MVKPVGPEVGKNWEFLGINQDNSLGVLTWQIWVELWTPARITNYEWF